MASEAFRVQLVVETTSMTETAISKRADLELVLRFFAFLEVPYQKGLDVHEYLYNAAISMAMDDNLDQDAQEQVFVQHSTLSIALWVSNLFVDGMVPSSPGSSFSQSMKWSLPVSQRISNDFVF